MWKNRLLILGILCSILVVGSVFAQVPYAKYSYFQNWGGLNDNLSSTEINDNEASDIQNIVFDMGGAIQKRFGCSGADGTNPASDLYKVASGDDVDIIGLKFFEKTNGDKFLVAVSAVGWGGSGDTLRFTKKEYSGGFSSGAWDSISTKSQTKAVDINDQCDFAVASDTLIFTIGGGLYKPYKWNGDTASASVLTSDPDLASATMIEYHKNHLFTNNASSPAMVCFSNLDDMLTWDTLDFFLCENGDGSQVRGLVSAFNSLYIFLDYSIWRLSGYERDSFSLEKMVEGVGTKSQQSIQVIGNLIYFVTAENDIAVYDGGYSVAFPSQKIRQTISDMNYDRSEYALGAAFSTYRNADRDYYASLTRGGSSENDRVLLFDTSHKSWSKFSGLKANAWTVGDGGSGKDVLYFGGDDGCVYYYPSISYYDYATPSTVAIAAFYQTKWFKYQEAALGDKYWRLLRTWALSEDDTTLYAECRADYEATGTVVGIDLGTDAATWDVSAWDEVLWGGDSVIVDRKEINKGKNMFQIKYYNNELDESFTILGFDVFIEPTDRI